MRATCSGFIDAGFLRAQGAAAVGRKPWEVRLNAAAVVDWLRSRAPDLPADQDLLRTYWYDGAFDPSHVDYRRQRRFFDAIAFTPGIQLRLGHVAENPVDLDSQLRQAVRQAAQSLEIEPTTLLEEFK